MSEVTDAPARDEATIEVRPLQGSHIWYELMTTDPDGAKRFYEAIVPGLSIGDPLPGAGLAAQARAARARMLTMPFEDFEREVRGVLTSLLAPGGFDAARDILAITVNRWPHGYARDHMDLEDSNWNADPLPETVGRQRFGNIAIANSDAGADAYTHTAIDQAWRAVNELRGARS